MRPPGAWATALALLVAILFFDHTDVDLRVQDAVFDPTTGAWVVDGHAPGPRLAFYDGPKGVAIVVGLACLGYLGWSWATGRGTHRREAGMMFAALALVPGIVAGAKALTDVHCPCDLERYGGRMPHVRVLGSRPPVTATRPRGRCYPAGHATAGFAFLMLYFVLPARWRGLGLAYGLAAGWVLGTYQTLKGVHFLGHTVASMLASWLVVLGIARAAGATPLEAGARTEAVAEVLEPAG